jgi:hypothetical protein
MPTDNLSAPAEPVAVPSPQSEEELISDISNLLDDPSPDPVEEPEEAAAAPAEDDDPLGLGAEDVDADATAEAGDESDEPEIKGGRFAPDSAKVTLDDGTVTTIAELKRGTLFQRDYTKKTQELSKEKETFEAERQQVSQYAQQLDQSREYLTWYAEQFLPKQPGPFTGDARQDPQAFIEWQQDVAKWQTHAQAWQQFQQSKQDEEQRKSGETQKQMQERHKREAEALFKAIPVLKDPAKGKQVWDNIVSGATQLGFTAEEVNGITDHRMILALRKAIAYDRIKSSAPKVQQEVTKRPVVNNGRRAPANQQVQREKQARTERLRSDPSFENGVAALMDFDL